MNVIIVDDEPLAHEVLNTYVGQVNDLKLIKNCFNAIEAKQAVEEGNVDLMLLDIQMPQITGLELVKSLPSIPLVIFTTAFEEYALESYEIDAVDYLVKPISFDKFTKAIHKAKERFESEAVKDVEEDYFYVKSDKKLVKLFYNDILFIEGLKDYVIIKTEKGRVITLQTMKSLEEKLSKFNFIRIHRSYIINISRINVLLANMVEIMVAGKEKHLPIGKNYREKFFALINDKKL